MPVATVILPTTGERWELMQFSLECIRNQDFADIEIFVAGDGVGPATRERCLAWQREDARVRFFDYPKHARRGEPYRHELLTQHARGRIVLYCCDRDLWFPHHVSTLATALESAEFAHTLVFSVEKSGAVRDKRLLDVGRPWHRRRFTRGAPPLPGIPLSAVGHTLESYRRLEEGWATTPPGRFTDLVMWQKFLRRPDVRAVTVRRPTLLYFNRGNHPGWPVPQRRDELQRWMPAVRSAEGYVRCLEAYCGDLYADRAALFDRVRHPVGALLRRTKERVRQFDLRHGGRAGAIWRRLRRRGRPAR